MRTRKKTTTTTTTVVEEVPVDGVARPTLVTFLIDRSGSMNLIKAETIGGFNAYLDRLEAEAGNLIEFTLLQFDSDSVDKLCVGAPLSQVPRFTDENFLPRAWTPLVDACVKTIRATEELVQRRAADQPRVIVAIMTDGEENNSREYNRDYLYRLIREKTALGWQFLYMGANIDAYRDARSFGISTVGTMSYDSGSTRQAFQASAQNSILFATGAMASTGYSLQQKSAAGDTFDPSFTGGLGSNTAGPGGLGNKTTGGIHTTRPRRSKMYPPATPNADPAVDDITFLSKTELS